MSVTANSLLTAIVGPPEVDDYLEAAGDGAQLWAGRTPAYLTRARRGTQDQSLERKGATDTLYVLDAGMAPILEQAGREDQETTVTVIDQRAGTSVTRSFKVLGVEHRAAGTSVDSIKIDLDRETA